MEEERREKRGMLAHKVSTAIFLKGLSHWTTIVVFAKEKIDCVLDIIQS